MDLNDAVYEQVKKFMSGEKGTEELLLKICLGTATVEEKKKWQENTELSEEVTNKLKECCDVGYNMAAQLDSNENILLQKIDKLVEQVALLTERVEKLEGRK